jgi:hypothetical protein
MAFSSTPRNSEDLQSDRVKGYKLMLHRVLADFVNCVTKLPVSNAGATKNRDRCVPLRLNHVAKRRRTQPVRGPGYILRVAL